jgi:hypothetical protein
MEIKKSPFVSFYFVAVASSVLKKENDPVIVDVDYMVKNLYGNAPSSSSNQDIYLPKNSAAQAQGDRFVIKDFYSAVNQSSINI